MTSILIIGIVPCADKIGSAQAGWVGWGWGENLSADESRWLLMHVLGCRNAVTQHKVPFQLARQDLHSLAKIPDHLKAFLCYWECKLKVKQGETWYMRLFTE